MVIGALLVSVVSYAQSSPASASNGITSINISGGSGRPIAQGIPGSADLISVALSGTSTVSLTDNTGFVVGDYVRIGDGFTSNYHTVSGVSEGSISVTPPLSTSFAVGGTTTIEEQAVYDQLPTGNPIIGSTTSVRSGNHFLMRRRWRNSDRQTPHLKHRTVREINELPEMASKEEHKTKGVMDLIAIIAVIGPGYFAVVFSLGTFQPIGAVISGSMEPVLSRGDLVILRHVSPSELRVGDIAQVEIPRALQEQFGLPPNNLHRITDIQQAGNNVQFITKGDANNNIDPVPVAPDRVGGIMVFHVPYGGHLFLFLNSAQGRIFALVMGLAVFGYIGFISISDNWRNVVVAAQTGAGTLSPEAAEQARILAEQEIPGSTTPTTAVAADDPSGSPVGVAAPPAVGVLAPPTMAASDLRLMAGVAEERLEDIETGITETRESLQGFSAAIAEYGTHLQSHTSTVRAMSTASESLVEAVDRQNIVLERLEITLDREPGDREPDLTRPATTQRRVPSRTGRSPLAGTGPGATTPRATSRTTPGTMGPSAISRARMKAEATNVDASVDDRPTVASVDSTPRGQRAERRSTTGGADFRSALRKVSIKRRPPRRG